MSEKNFFKKAIDDMKESAKEQHKIDKANYETVKAESKKRHEELTAEDPKFKEFKEAKGIKAKARVVAEHAVENGKKITVENRTQYKELLKEQRENINKNTKK